MTGLPVGVLSVVIVLWCCPMDSGFTLSVREKYGETIVLNETNCVIEKDGSYYVSIKGRLHGVYPKCNYSVERR